MTAKNIKQTTTMTKPKLTQSQYAKQLNFATAASVLTASALIILKLIAWAITGSVSIMASLVDSLMDALASMINLLAVRYSLAPADSEHRFGHGKAEPLAGLIQASFICGSAVFLILHAIERLQKPEPLQDIAIGISIMVVATILTIALLFIQRRVIKQTGSTAIRADALHYTGDVLSNLSIIVALIISYSGITWADSVFAIAIAMYISFHAWRIGHDAFQQLMDRELDDEEKNKVIRAVLSHPQVKGAHDLRTRQSGQTKFIQMHIELDDNLPLIESHRIADAIEVAIKSAIPQAEVLLHQDPISIVEEVQFQLKEH